MPRDIERLLSRLPAEERARATDTLVQMRSALEHATKRLVLDLETADEVRPLPITNMHPDCTRQPTLSPLFTRHPLCFQALKQHKQIQLDLSNAELRHQIKEAAVETLEERVTTAKEAQPGANIDELEQAAACYLTRSPDHSIACPAASLQLLRTPPRSGATRSSRQPEPATTRRSR